MKIRTVAAVACLVLSATLGGVGAAAADSEAHGVAIGSPGVLSGNVVQVPIHIPINICGNSVNIIGVLNPAAANVCIND
ncbi:MULTISPECIES: chaplin [unclassified Streptomyces]|uniref:chaplin n=1 Tax=unclassified Streptomyces TaxID=2593676 RepID=UPI001BEBD26E|nr:MULTISPECIES: chaplin [unclassified Streptomyces]MBT2406581.1 chaplin [Streptomyces sp. ISL-21]MBT2458049.1 chaplin [Streptomyces sp. ISL-86]MBT2608919.1 chaplin [Streptomyces sp. ISL-87]